MMKKTASIANIKPMMAAPPMAAATWLMPAVDEAKDDCDEVPVFIDEDVPPPPLDMPDEPGTWLPPVAVLTDGVKPGKVVDVMVPMAAPGEMAIKPGGGSAPGGLLDETATGIKTTDWFVGGGGDGAEDGGGGDGDE